MPGIRESVWERLGFTKANAGCCGNLWRSRRAAPELDPVIHGIGAGEEICEIPAQEEAAEVNSPTAMAEERRMPPPPDPAMHKPPLISWLEGEEEEEGERQAVGLGDSCCVCMERKKGAAFIPCGHAFCRVCARELWIERRSCALCNQTILEVLDIF